MSILGFGATLVSLAAGIGSYIYFAKKAEKHLGWWFVGAFTSPAIVLTLMFGAQALGINTACWLMYNGAYLIAPGGI